MIRHLVFSGAGPYGITQLGIITEYEKQGLLQRDQLDKIFACSAGTMSALLFVFNIPIADAVHYMVKRPWEKFAKIDLFESNEKGGIVDCEKIKDMIHPLMLAFDIPLDVTFEDIKKYSNIDLHIFATNMETLQSVDFNVHTHPKMPITTATMLTCAVPPIFTMGSYDGMIYGDGGLSDNFPLAALLEHPSKPDPFSVFCINMTGPLPEFKTKFSLIELVSYIAQKAVLKATSFNYNHDMALLKCKHYVFCKTKSIISKEVWDNFLYSEEERQKMFDIGIETAKAHIIKLESGAERC